MADKKTLSPEEKKLAAEKHVKKLVVGSLKTKRPRTCSLVNTL